MNTRIYTGKGITGALRYVQGEGRHPITNELLTLGQGHISRATLIGGTGFGFDVKTANDAEICRRVMERITFHQASKTRKCRQVCLHLVLSWAKGQNPSQEEMDEAAQSALRDGLGIGNAMSLIYSHNDEDYAHIHIIVLKINPATGYAYDLEASQRKLSAWALQYEIDHGGVINTRRQTANELRKAIARRDAGGVLEALTKQRATFTPAQLKRAIHKEIHWKTADKPEQKAAVEAERSRFEAEIIAHPEIAGLADEPGSALTRYTTRTVLEAEGQVLHAAEQLAASDWHACGDDHQARIEASNKYRTMTAEQLNAFLRATRPEGLALIDGQAGTGKSFTIEAIREAYEQAGHRVIGLAPTNIVKEDMKASGFAHAATVHAELFALANGRTAWSRDTVVIVDEAAMLDTRIMALLATSAAEAGAKLILARDDRQLSSIDRGGMFGALKDRYGAAVLSEVKRQYKADERRASEMMAEGNFHDALGIYQQKGAIRWTRTEREARASLINQWAEDTARRPGQTRFVFAYTNDAVDELNAALRSIRKDRGELGLDHEIQTPLGPRNLAVGDRIQFTANDCKQGIANGAAGTIEAIDGTHLAVGLDTKELRTINFDARNFGAFRHGYAGTIYKSQGKTLDQTYLFHTDHWRAASSYVALTRHRAQTQLFVARNTAKNLAELARQIGRRDEQRAASQFFPIKPIDPALPVGAAELNARFAADNTRWTHDAKSRQTANDNKSPSANDNQTRRPETPFAFSLSGLSGAAPSPFNSRRRHRTQTLDETASVAPLALDNRLIKKPQPTPRVFHPGIAGVHKPGYALDGRSTGPARGRANTSPDRLAAAGSPGIPGATEPVRDSATPQQCPQKTRTPKLESGTSIRDQFGKAKRAVTRRGDPSAQALRRKRKQKEDGRQIFIPAARSMLKRAARRLWTIFWERETLAAPCQDMHLDPRYAAWYTANPDDGGISSHDCNWTHPGRPPCFSSPNL